MNIIENRIRDNICGVGDQIVDDVMFTVQKYRNHRVVIEYLSENLVSDVTFLTRCMILKSF